MSPQADLISAMMAKNLAQLTLTTKSEVKSIAVEVEPSTPSPQPLPQQHQQQQFPSMAVPVLEDTANLAALREALTSSPTTSADAGIATSTTMPATRLLTPSQM